MTLILASRVSRKMQRRLQLIVLISRLWRSCPYFCLTHSGSFEVLMLLLNKELLKYDAVNNQIINNQ